MEQASFSCCSFLCVVLAAACLKYRRCRLSCLPFVWHLFFHCDTHTHMYPELNLLVKWFAKRVHVWTCSAKRSPALSSQPLLCLIFFPDGNRPSSDGNHSWWKGEQRGYFHHVQDARLIGIQRDLAPTGAVVKGAASRLCRSLPHPLTRHPGQQHRPKVSERNSRQIEELHPVYLAGNEGDLQEGTEWWRKSGGRV